MANEKSGFESNADFWNWLKNRNQASEAYKPLELTIDYTPVMPREDASRERGTHDISKEFEISSDVSFEISGNVVYELG